MFHHPVETKIAVGDYLRDFGFGLFFAYMLSSDPLNCSRLILFPAAMGAILLSFLAKQHDFGRQIHTIGWGFAVCLIAYEFVGQNVFLNLSHLGLVLMLAGNLIIPNCAPQNPTSSPTSPRTPRAMMACLLARRGRGRGAA